MLDIGGGILVVTSAQCLWRRMGGFWRPCRESRRLRKLYGIAPTSNDARKVVLMFDQRKADWLLKSALVVLILLAVKKGHMKQELYSKSG